MEKQINLEKNVENQKNPRIKKGKGIVIGLVISTASLLQGCYGGYGAVYYPRTQCDFRENHIHRYYLDGYDDFDLNHWHRWHHHPRWHRWYYWNQWHFDDCD